MLVLEHSRADSPSIHASPTVVPNPGPKTTVSQLCAVALAIVRLRMSST